MTKKVENPEYALIRINGNVRDKLKKFAKENGLKMMEMINRGLERAINSQDNLFLP
ncbi:hypothetical protein [Victivallis sp. Marseille-Q1083]|uniref:hypothetical protein n=1 Tax=Victivallis sp. Marseille-Q1083 TaxID=2717288 RepID=UPI00158B2C7F|nr:hypothetical protein [Victivallis sp. Marseille-Q1083]